MEIGCNLFKDCLWVLSNKTFNEILQHFWDPPPPPPLCTMDFGENEGILKSCPRVAWKCHNLILILKVFEVVGWGGGFHLIMWSHQHDTSYDTINSCFTNTITMIYILPKRSN